MSAPGPGSGPEGSGSPKKKGGWKRRLKRIALVLVVLAVPAGFFTWYQFFRDVPQPAWVTADPETNFLYGSIGSEGSAGIPYWIVVVLPRIFDDLLPGPGGYASLGLPWEEGRELPAGFSKKTVGFERVGFNCALCHSTQYRTDAQSPVDIVAGGGSHTADIQGLLNFFGKAANDSRFNAETILTQVDLTYKLGWLDRLLYKFLFIPLTRKQLAQQGADFAWADDLPAWGPGRDAPMNLTKFNFLQLPVDGSVDNTDFPSLWNLGVRVQEGRTWPANDFALTADWSTISIPPERLMLMNLDGATTSFRSVIIDSALGLQAQNTPFFHRRIQEIEDWMTTVSAPSYPLPYDEALAARGEAVFEAECASCHAPGRDNRLGTVIPLAEIGTDPERVRAWTREAADSANRVVRSEIGITRTPMSVPDAIGYIALQLDGAWLRAPYLHNGSVPTLRALLEPPAERPTTFYRGYDVIDRHNVGFVSRRCPGDRAELPDDATSVDHQWGCMPNYEGWLYDTSVRGNSAAGHDYGTALSAADKTMLLEYLKTR